MRPSQDDLKKHNNSFQVKAFLNGADSNLLLEQSCREMMTPSLISNKNI
jgi:hypothetical protein